MLIFLSLQQIGEAYSALDSNSVTIELTDKSENVLFRRTQYVGLYVLSQTLRLLFQVWTPHNRT